MEAGGFDEIAQRAVDAANSGGLEKEAAEIASKTERVMRPSMAVRTQLASSQNTASPCFVPQTIGSLHRCYC